MKRLLILILLTGVGYAGYSQAKSADSSPTFEKSFYSNFKHPKGLMDAKTPVFGVMKVWFDKKGAVDSLDFSDSVPIEFAAEMQRVKSKVNFSEIYQNLEISDSSIPVLIPVQMDAMKSFFGPASVKKEDLEKLYLFKGKPIAGEFVFYKPIYLLYIYE
jgi:hypothetical protein